MRVLVVRDSFADYVVGQMITDPKEIEALEANGQDAHCTRSEVDDSFFAPPAKPSKADA
jgi:hypothetical protein